MVSIRRYVVPMLLAPLMYIPVATHAASCDASMPSQACSFTNALDFDGYSFDHISFDPLDERTPLEVENKFANVASFTIAGGDAAIRHTSQHSSNFYGEGTEGGPVSGEWRIDWGYYGQSNVVITFNTPVDAVGAFIGGDVGNYQTGYALMDVIFEDNTSMRVTRSGAGLPQVPDGSDGCHAINGFLGADSNGGPKIVKVTFSEANDAASLDSIFFGTASGGSKGPGPTRFAENPFSGACASVQLPTTSGNAANNMAPVAVPGTSLDANNVLQLDGSLSSDPEGDALTYSWQISGQALARTGKTVLINDLASGNYDVILTVSDGINSTSSMMKLAVQSCGTIDTQAIYDQGFADGVASVDTQAFYNQGFVDGVASVDTQAIYNQGYTAGYTAGYNQGYADGQAAAVSSCQLDPASCNIVSLPGNGNGINNPSNGGLPPGQAKK